MVLQQALRSLQRAPVYSLTVILTLALGLASVGAMFAVVHGLLLAPLPYAEPDRLVSVELALQDGARLGHSPALQATYRRFATQFEDVALYRTGTANVWTKSEDAGAENIRTSWITASLMRVLRAPPLLGRAFSDDEERRGGPDAVILGESEWRTRFNASADVIGKTLIVNDVPREIVGVMPMRFAFPDPGIRLWLPAKPSDATVAGDFFYTAVARLAPHADTAAVEQELGAVLPRLAELFPRLQSGGSTAAWIDDTRPALRVQPLHDVLTRGIAPTLWVLAGVAGLIFFVAWANVANLVLIRIDAQRQQRAVREALGASSLRASMPLFGEAVLLGAAAAALALLASFAAVAALKTFGPTDLPRLNELAFGPWSATFVTLAALAGTLAGTAVLTHVDGSKTARRSLHDGARTQTSGKSRQRLRATASVLQIAAALVVLAGSALLLRTADRLNDVHPGFDAEGVTTFRILLPFARYGESERVAFHARLTEAAGRLPSVHAAGLIARLPLGPGSSPEQAFKIEGGTEHRSLPVNVASDGYFKAMHTPMIAGRDFGPIESQRADELILSRRAATLLFAGADPSDVPGRMLRLEPGGPDYTVIGVVGDVLYDDLAIPAPPMVYRPQVVAHAGSDPGPLPAMVLAVRSDAARDVLVDAVRRIVRELDRAVPVFEVRSMSEVIRYSMARLTLTLAVMSAAAATALALAMLGLYGVIGYSVALRTREFGIRVALGADPRRVRRFVFHHGMALTAIGVAAGLAVFSLAAPALRASVSGVAVWDPLPLAGAIALLAAASALACWIPALRAAAVEPARALRAE